MRISELHVFQKNLPVVGGPYSWSNSVLESVDTTILKIVSDTGLVGWGETAPLGAAYQPQHALGARAAMSEMGKELVGESLMAPLLLRRRMDELLNGHNYAKAAIDIAVMDLRAKYYGLRVCDLLGGAATHKVPAYFATGIGDPDEIARLAVDKVSQGYSRIQIKSGGRDLSIDIAVVHKVWEAVGDRAQIVVDANRAMTASEALRLSLSCSKLPIVLEQPCNTMEEINSIRSQISHPIYLDENTESPTDVLRAIALGVCDGFGLKITRLGGLNAFATVRDICAMRSMPHTCEDTWGGDITAAAILHAAVTVTPRLLEAVWIPDNYIEEHYDPINGIQVISGQVELPKGDGLGITPDESQFGSPVFSFS
jgi:L-alanine-DL-glutamate epimerase-like enolase superfamily enzyme